MCHFHETASDVDLRTDETLDAKHFKTYAGADDVDNGVHRSYLVNVAQVKELRPWFGGDAVLVLHDGHELKVSRTYRAQLKQRLNAV